MGTLSLAWLARRLYVDGSMFPADAHDNRIPSAQILGLILVVVVVTEAIAP
jgi:hypothetical protein